ncbi:sensor histidine kinase [Mammaliicoccus stepanovicii]|uniref:Sensor histidine kinase n=1 Tax=Mammaliicoccus stepanovicii TaxID=643214 RepID=A0A239YJE4_9STAP|nr:sensor histidine kinase [Mammaliicoccus stepanovicii]PNZ77888.1 two-component sensor histidine kinase [Mammaliicoccus stepanovicii]GGI40949.1 oxygen sensor histidine kinase NreB [Mammaliicoccus stepanovicii]SNV58860.1 two-component sensor histidine kinase NreB [Mammaliicoccus stepanovicii]
MNSHETSKLTNILKQYYEKTSEMIMFLNSDGQIIDMNKAAKKVISEENQESLTHAICNRCEGYSNEFALQSCRDCFLDSSNVGNNSFQVFMQTTNGSVEPFTATYQTISEEDDIKVYTLQNVSPQIERQQKLHQQTMMQKIISAQENERKRISRELHDGVVQELLNVSVELRLLKYQDDIDQIKSQAQGIETVMSRLIDDIRNLSLELRPSSLDDLGLNAAFKSYFKQLEKNFGFIVHYHFDSKDERFNTEIETVVYRIVQEAVFNSLKYANVDSVDVHMVRERDHIEVEIADQGVGFILGSAPKGSGLGLYGMQERAEIVGGHINIESKLGKGTNIKLKVPIA